MITRHALLILIGMMLALWAFTRACNTAPATSQPGAPTRVSATWPPGPYEPIGGRLWLPATGATVRESRTVGARLPFTADVRGPGRVCSAAWAPNSAWYLAAHCRAYNPLLMRVAGVPVTAWQSDAGGRDLAQARAGDGGALPVLAHPSPGDAVTLRPARGDVAGTYYGGAWARQWADGYELGTEAFEAARPMGVVCAAAGAIGRGDSGGGMYRGDGALGGIIVAVEDGADFDAWCGDSQRVLVEFLP